MAGARLRAEDFGSRKEEGLWASVSEIGDGEWDNARGGGVVGGGGKSDKVSSRELEYERGAFHRRQPPLPTTLSASILDSPYARLDLLGNRLVLFAK